MALKEFLTVHVTPTAPETTPRNWEALLWSLSAVSHCGILHVVWDIGYTSSNYMVVIRNRTVSQTRLRRPDYGKAEMSQLITCLALTRQSFGDSSLETARPEARSRNLSRCADQKAAARILRDAGTKLLQVELQSMETFEPHSPLQVGHQTACAVVQDSSAASQSTRREPEFLLHAFCLEEAIPSVIVGGRTAVNR